MYVVLNYISNGIGIIDDAVIAIGLYIAFYYGLTGFDLRLVLPARTLTSSARNLWMQGILPGLGWLIMWSLGGWTPCRATGRPPRTTTPSGRCRVCTGRSAAIVPHRRWWPRWQGCRLHLLRITSPAFFRKETLTRATPTLVPDPDA